MNAFSKINRKNVFIAAVASAGAASIAATNASPPAGADMVYDFSYTAPEITASGQFTTSSTPIASGAYKGGYDMLSISGQRNGVTITGLLDPSAAGTNVTKDSTGFDNVFYPIWPACTLPARQQKYPQASQ